MKHRPLSLSRRGFTLLETIVYLALLTLMIVGTFGVVWQIFNYSGKLSDKGTLQEEANFILRKVDWALSSWPTNSSGTSVSVSGGSTLTISDSGTLGSPLIFALSGTDITLKRATATALPLNSGNVKVTALSFVVTPKSGTKPLSVVTTFTLLEAQSGQTGTFSTTKYLRI